MKILKISLQDRLKNYIDRKNDWIIKAELADYARALGFMGETHL